MKPAEITLVTRAVVALASVCGATLGGCALLAPNKPAPAAEAPQAPPPSYVADNLKHTRAELEQQVATETTGFEKDGESPGKLDPFEPIDVPVKRGHCYKIAVILDDGVELSDHAKHGISFVVKREGQLDLRSLTAFGPGGVVDLGCPNDTLVAHVDVIADWGSATDKGHLHDLGSGGFKTVVYSKTITEKALAERNQQIKENDEKQAREQAEFNPPVGGPAGARARGAARPRPAARARSPRQQRLSPPALDDPLDLPEQLRQRGRLPRPLPVRRVALQGHLPVARLRRSQSTIAVHLLPRGHLPHSLLFVASATTMPSNDSA